MRIGELVQGMWYGGMEKMAGSLSISLQKRGHDVTVYCYDDYGPNADAVRSEGVPVWLIPRSQGIDWVFIFRIVRRIREDRIELLHCHNDTAFFYGFLASRLAHVPIVYTRHSLDYSVKNIKKIVHSVFYRGTSAIVTVAEEIGERLVLEENAPRDRLHVVWNGVDGGQYRLRDREYVLRKKMELGIPTSARVLGTVGRYWPEKNQVILFDVLAALVGPDTQDDIVLVLVGDGPLRPELETAARKKGISRKVLMTGLISNTETVYPVFDVFLMSSVREGLPLAIIEAMACSLPIVSTDVGGIRNIIRDGETGYLVPSGDSSAMADRVRILLGNPLLANKIGHNARKFFEDHLSEERMVDAYEDIFKSVVCR